MTTQAMKVLKPNQLVICSLSKKPRKLLGCQSLYFPCPGGKFRKSLPATLGHQRTLGNTLNASTTKTIYGKWRVSYKEELRACKEDFLENLSKGFNDSSKSTFAAPILFVRK